MKGLGSMVVALFRPKRGFDGLAVGAKWLWLLPLALLIVSAMLKAGVSTPLVMKEQEAFIAEQMGQVTIDGESAMASDEPASSDSEKEKARAEAEPGSPDVVVPDDQMATVSAIATTSAVVFGGIGAAVAVLFTAFFFFIAGKVAAKETRFGAFLTLASVAFVPHALRNLVQTLYMHATGSPVSTGSGRGPPSAPTWRSWRCSRRSRRSSRAPSWAWGCKGRYPHGQVGRGATPRAGRE